MKYYTKYSQKSLRVLSRKLFWLFVIGSVAGVIMEGTWCLARKGHWEYHVYAVWGPFCVIYGVGAVAFYLVNRLLAGRSLPARFLVFALTGAAVELAVGLFLNKLLHLTQWDYSRVPCNLKGYVCLGMTALWGAVGVTFQAAAPLLERLLSYLSDQRRRSVSAVLAVLVAADLMLTGACMLRWHGRAYGEPPRGCIDAFIDAAFTDEMMESRFAEWRFTG